MSRRFLSGLALMLAAAGSAAAAPPDPTPAPPLPSVTLPAELDRVLRDYEKAWQARDADGLAVLFAEDGFVLASGRPPARGREAIRAAYAGAGGPLALRALAYSTEGPVGYIIGAFGRVKDGEDSGKFVLALRRGSDGRWLIAADMDNSNRRPSPGAFTHAHPAVTGIALTLALCAPLVAQGASEPPTRRIRKPKPSWTLQVGLAHSEDDAEHYAVSGFQGRFPLIALDRRDKSDRLGGFGLEVGLYPYPVTSRAYVPGTDADPNTPGKYNFWEAAGLSYYSPRLGPLQLEAGARLAFINATERVLTSPNGCGLGNRDEPRCNAYLKESMKTLDSIFFPSFRGDRGVVTFVAAALTVSNFGVRVEAARLNSGGARINATGLRFGLTVR